MADKETVTLKLPSGESVDFIVPGGLSDAEVKTFVLSKRPDLFQQQASGAPDVNAQAKQVLQNIPQYTSPAAGREANDPKNAYMQQNAPMMYGAAGGMAGGALAPSAAGLPAPIRALATSSSIGAGAGAGQLALDPTKPAQALNTAAGATATSMALSPIAKFIQDLGAKAKAGPMFKAVSEAAAENPIETSMRRLPELQGPIEAANQAKQLQNAGFSMPRVLNRFLARISTGEPLTFEEARNFEQAAGGKLSTDEAMRLKPQMRAQLAQFADQMRKATMQAAGNVGKADTFADALSQYHAGAQAQAKQEMAREAMMELIKMAGKGAAYGAGAGGAYQAGKALLGGKK